MIKKIFRLFHTIKYLKIIQLYYRLLYLFPKYYLFNKKNEFQLNEINYTTKFIRYKNITKDFENFKFLNEAKLFSDIGWENKNLKKLFIYNLNYFDYLNQKNHNVKSLQKEKIIDWIKNNININSTAWEPYPMSLRIVNWIKWYSFNNNFSSLMLNSLWNQTKFLSKNLEFHLLGNHLLANLKAIFFSRSIFNDNKVNKIYLKALKIFKYELNEQFLDDGGHFELSPMYHAILIEDLLDLVNISNDLPKNFPVESIKIKIINGMEWLYYMTYINGEFSHFNDSVNDIAPDYNLLFDYSKRLNIKLKKPKRNYKYLSKTGYFIIKNSNVHLIADVGNVGPDYLPGHAHADTLSFELFLNDTRFIVNSGISTYENNNIRKQQRSTSYHNTLEINDLNSSDVWASFRVGKRANTSNLFTNVTNDRIEFSCSHNGYNSCFNKIIHQRGWVYKKNKIIIIDKIFGEIQKCKSRFYFHPSVKLKRDRKQIIAYINEKKICRILTDENNRILKSHYFPSFGIKKSNLCLIIDIKKSGTYKTVFEF